MVPRMATMFSFLGICNAALISQGMDEIVQDEDGTPEFRLLSRNWPGIVEAELETGAHAFALAEATLLSRQPGRYGYADSYLLPLEALHVRRLWSARGGMRADPDWVQDGASVHVDAPGGVGVQIVTSADPSFWGANFSRGVQKKLEAEILRAFKEEYQAAGMMEVEAERAFSQARALASKSRASRPMMLPGPIALARFRRA